MEKFLLNYKPKAVENKPEINDDFVSWSEKYRPKTINDVTQQEEVIKVLNKCMQGSDFPNLLFYGPSGTGKTSTVLAMARELYGSYFKERVLELNASDERGISVIRERIKTFSKNTINTAGDAKKLVKFKLVILDEADSMTSAAQAALRRTMELYCESTRFCIMCNYITRISDPIASRCMKFRFKPLDSSAAIDRLSYICDNESLKVSHSSLLRLINLVEGDLRRAITVLQSASFVKQTDNDSYDLSEEFFNEIVGEVPNNILENLFSLLVKNPEFPVVQKEVDYILRQGYSTAQIISQMHDYVLSSNDRFNDQVKCKIIGKIAISDSQILSGSDEYLQLMSVTSFILEIIDSL